MVSRSLFHVQSSGRKEVTGANVLVAIFSEQESQAVYLLKVQGVTRIDVVNYISHGISKAEDGKPQRRGSSLQTAKSRLKRVKKPCSFMQQI